MSPPTTATATRMPKDRFWEHKTLDELDGEEWEALCDGCGRCCLLKIEDEDSGQLFYTNVVCEHYDNDQSRCRHYRDRSLLVPDCIKVTPEVARTQNWLPDTCAYRLLAEGKAALRLASADQRQPGQRAGSRYIGARQSDFRALRASRRAARTPRPLAGRRGRLDAAESGCPACRPVPQRVWR